MSGQAALRISPVQHSVDEKTLLVERCYEDFAEAHRMAMAALGSGAVTLDETLFLDSIGRAVGVAARLRECLDYEASPVLAAYLNTMFDDVIAHLLDSRATREVCALQRAGHLMRELQRAFLGAHRRAAR